MLAPNCLLSAHQDRNFVQNEFNGSLNIVSFIFIELVNGIFVLDY